MPLTWLVPFSVPVKPADRRLGIDRDNVDPTDPRHWSPAGPWRRPDLASRSRSRIGLPSGPRAIPASTVTPSAVMVSPVPIVAVSSRRRSHRHGGADRSRLLCTSGHGPPVGQAQGGLVAVWTVSERTGQRTTSRPLSIDAHPRWSSMVTLTSTVAAMPTDVAPGAAAAALLASLPLSRLQCRNSGGIFGRVREPESSPPSFVAKSA